MKYYCYILSNKNKNRTVLYIGYTDNLKRRVMQHKSGNGSLFTKKYNVNDLVYFEQFEDNKSARKREKQLKNWHKEWKWDMIKKLNPNLRILEIE